MSRDHDRYVCSAKNCGEPMACAWDNAGTTYALCLSHAMDVAKRLDAQDRARALANLELANPGGSDA